MRARCFPVVVLLSLTATIGVVVSASADGKVVAPDVIPGTTKVDAEGVFDLAGKYPGLIIIDARIREDRAQGYIEGSTSLPDVATTCDSLAAIVPKKTAPVLFYCNGPKCGRSVHSARKALACGYKDVYWFRGGFEEWKDKNYPFLKE